MEEEKREQKIKRNWVRRRQWHQGVSDARQVCYKKERWRGQMRKEGKYRE